MTVHTRKLSGLSNALLRAVAPIDDDCALIKHKGPLTTSKLELVHAQQQCHTGLGRTSQDERLLKRSTSSCRIRSRLLNSLGIEKEQQEALMGAPRATEPSPVVLRGQHDAFDMILKADHGKPDKGLERFKKQSTNKDQVIATSPGDPMKTFLLSNPFSSCTYKANEEVGSRSVCFDAMVKVHPIPARCDYSQRMQAALWTPQEELQQNAARNQFEFAAEEWDYTKVVDDEDMVMYEGERVHPVHFLPEEELREYFRGVMKQQELQDQQEQKQQN